MENDENWAKADTPDVEDAKSAFYEAQQVETLLAQITSYSAGAVKYGSVDRDYVNAWLSRLGAQPVTGAAEYKIHVPIDSSYGTTVTANSRTEALEKFKAYFGAVLEAGEVRPNGYGHGVFEVSATADEPVFVSGPQDPPEAVDKTPGLDALKTDIRRMLMQGVIEKGWNYSYASTAVAAMGLEALPTLDHRKVAVAVSGTTWILVSVFEGASPEDVQNAAAGFLARATSVTVSPDEVGAVVLAPRSDMGLTLVDEDDEESFED